VAVATALAVAIGLEGEVAASLLAGGLLLAAALQHADCRPAAARFGCKAAAEWVGGPQATVLRMDAGTRRAGYLGGDPGVTEDDAAATAPAHTIEPDYLPAEWVQGTRAFRQGRLEQALHRALDIIASLSLILLTLPLMLLVAAAIRIDSRGPIFYGQARVGRDGRVFTIFKFRSMTADAEAPGAPVWASVGDPRVTRIGHMLRISRIDEIPQVVNILRGDMAFVGPRPERPSFVAQLRAAIPHYADRSVVRPGLTGWAQVRYRYGASVEDARTKLSYDLYYIQERSIGLDLRIILSTVRVVLCGLGAR
jgi:lipopolysaccharide/colanic/teichoic acid biosynthesis glycosyltransferase